jgi:hypothetical protein
MVRLLALKITQKGIKAYPLQLSVNLLAPFDINSCSNSIIKYQNK